MIKQKVLLKKFRNVLWQVRSFSHGVFDSLVNTRCGQDFGVLVQFFVNTITKTSSKTIEISKKNKKLKGWVYENRSDNNR